MDVLVPPVAPDLGCVTRQRVTILMAEGERSFYEAVQDAAAPAHDALMKHAAAADDNPDEAGPSSPRESPLCSPIILLVDQLLRPDIRMAT